MESYGIIGAAPAPERKTNWIAKASIVANVALVGAVLCFVPWSGSNNVAAPVMHRNVAPVHVAPRMGMSMAGIAPRRRTLNRNTNVAAKPVVHTVAMDAPVATTEESMTWTPAAGNDVDA